MLNTAKEIFFRNDNLLSYDDNHSSILLAANIDRNGNLFEIIEVFNLYDDGTLDIDRLELRKNGQIFAQFDLAAFFDEKVYSQCQHLDPMGRRVYLYDEVGDYDIVDAFIENENNWRFFFHGSVGRGFSEHYIGSYDSSGNDPLAVALGDRYNDRASISRSFAIFNGNVREMRTTSSFWYYIGSKYGAWDFRSYQISKNSTMPDISDIKFFLADSYYYKISEIKYFITQTFTHGEIPSTGVTVCWREYFSSDGRKLFPNSLSSSELTNGESWGALPTVFLKRVGSDFLFLKQYGDSGTLYLIRNDKKIPLKSGYFCNLGLQPTKKIKNWPKRIRELNL